MSTHPEPCTVRPIEPEKAEMGAFLQGAGSSMSWRYIYQDVDVYSVPRDEPGCANQRKLGGGTVRIGGKFVWTTAKVAVAGVAWTRSGGSFGKLRLHLLA